MIIRSLLSPFAQLVAFVFILGLMFNSSLLASPAFAQDADLAQGSVFDAPVAALSFDERHKKCLEAIADDPELAFEEAMIWRGDGGGRRARHCEAMALFALGHTAEAANRLTQLASSKLGGTPEMKANFYSEATDFWIVAEELDEALKSANAGLEIDKSHTGLRLARARVYAQHDRWDYADIDLSNAISFSPNEVIAWRLRADARRRLGRLEEARSDIEKAISFDNKSVENYLVRGQILEAIRLKASISAPPEPDIEIKPALSSSGH